MKYFILSFALLLRVAALLPADAAAEDMKPAAAALEKIDALGALALANEWRWTQKNIKSYVDTREVVFKFPNGSIKKIPLPADKMVVAIAPYRRKTHR